MPSTLRIPRARVDSLLAIANMTEEAFKEFFTESAKSNLASFSDHGTHTFCSRLKLTNKEDAQDILKLVQSLFAPIISTGKTSAQLVYVPIKCWSR